MLPRHTDTRVDPMGILGLTARYAYPTRKQRERVTILVKRHVGGTQVMVCVRSVRIGVILRLADDAQTASANALLFPAVSRQSLHDDEVFSRFETAARYQSVSVCISDNLGTTHFTFTDELRDCLSSLGGVNSIMSPDEPSSVVGSWQRNR